MSADGRLVPPGFGALTVARTRTADFAADANARSIAACAALWLASMCSRTSCSIRSPRSQPVLMVVMCIESHDFDHTFNPTPERLLERSSDEVEHSSHEVKESRDDVERSSDEVERSSHDVEESSHDVEESSQRRFQPKLARCGPRDGVERLLHRRREGVAHVEEKFASSSRLKSVVSRARGDGSRRKDDVE
jgi:hypothetical protein